MTDSPFKKEPVLEIKDLKTHFFTRRGVVKAVDGVSFSVGPEETLGLVGESGCGKSMTCLSILGLIPKPAGRLVQGRIILEGEDLASRTEQEMRRIRGKKIAMILQDPMSSLNPLFTIGDQVGAPIRRHQQESRAGVREKVLNLLRLVHIPSPEVRIGEYPHQMSGGMRQRIVGAMSLGCRPRLLIADEPTTALDVTIQAQFLKLLKEIQKATRLSLIMVTHDFGVVAKVCDRVAVMYAGRIIESAGVRDLFDRPLHPYTQALLASLPPLEKKVDKLYCIEGQPPDLIQPPAGCGFSPRCARAEGICTQAFPPERDFGNGHKVNCWLADR
jgi:oligopeptide/dipeptide ABC transporter ATP-binding protein